MFVLACAGAPDAPEAAAPTPTRETGLGTTLAGLAEQALLAGDLDAAENRYRRLASYDPRSVPARVGLARVAEARGDRGEARVQLERALAIDPAAVEAHLGLAALEADRDRARAHLDAALRASPAHPDVLAGLAEHTGRAPRASTSLADAHQLAEAHPFDPVVQLDAGQRLVDAGRGADARHHLEAAVGLADLAPQVGLTAASLLVRSDPAWMGWRVVPVHVHLDAELRRRPGWRFRQRLLWRDASVALGPVLETRFVPVSFTPFDAAPPGATLDARMRGLIYRTGSQAGDGLIAGFTSVPTPRRAGAKRGVAAYLGRHLFVRDARDEPLDRVLAHEILHVYGGIHVAEDLESLMNPGGGAMTLDPLNAGIVRVMGTRRFGPGGVDANVMPEIDIDEAIAAYDRALGANLVFRRQGLDALLGDAETVGPGAHARVQEITGLDDHLADVSRFVARLYWASERRVQSVVMLELAARLYGRHSPQGRAAWAQADVLRRRLRFELGVE